MATVKPHPFGVGRIRVRAQLGPDGAGRWWWRAELYQDGKSRTVWRGWATRDDAEIAVAAIRARDRLDEPEPGCDVGCVTVTDLVELWMGRQEQRQDLSPYTVAGQRTAARKLKAGIGPVRLARLDRITVERYRDARLRTGAASSSVRQELVALRCAWRYAREMEWIEARDLPSVRITVTPKRARATPTRGELVEVLRHLEGWPRMAVLFLAGTGCRLGEVDDIRWGALDLVAGVASVKGKTGAREVPLTPPLVVALEAWRASQPVRDQVFGVRRETMRKTLRQRIHAAIAAANELRDVALPMWSPHALRRAAVGALYRGGVDVGAAAALLGHSPSTALRHYRDVTEDDRREAVRMARLGYLEEGSVTELEAVRRRKPS